MRHVVIRPGRSRLIMTFCFAAYLAQNGFCLKDIYLPNGINYLGRIRAVMWVLDGL